MSKSILDTADPAGGLAFERHLFARLWDATIETVPWHRRLWDTGTVLTLREAHEAAEWLEAQVLSQSAMQWLCRDLERQAGADLGIGGPEARRQLRATLQAGLPLHSRHRRRLGQLIDMIDEGYVARWIAAAQAPGGASAERVARAISSHLLDRGYSMRYVHQVIRALTAAGASLAELRDEAERLAGASPHDFEVLVPFVVVPNWQVLATPMPEWRSGPQVRAWLAQNSGADATRHYGGFLYSIRAMDVFAAAHQAGELVDRLMTRSGYTRRNRSGLKPSGKLWVKGYREALPLEPPARGVDVQSLQRERTLYRVVEQDVLDDALELAGPLNKGAPGPAVAGGWAALESLLHHPGDPADQKEGRAVAAARLAGIVACSWPRAELTSLSHVHSPGVPDLLSAQLASAETNRDRAAAVATAIEAGRLPATSRDADTAAVLRMTQLVTSPKRTLAEVRGTVEASLRRLYRQRNIVLHGGSVQSVALRAALRTAAPLVGAGLDRIAHAYLVDQVRPLDLAARADLRLAMIGSQETPPVTDLLD